MQKTMILPVVRGWTVRDLVRSGFAERLKKNGVDLILLFTFSNKELIEEVRKAGFVAETIPLLHTNYPLRERIIRLIRNFILVAARTSDSYKIAIERSKNSNPLKYWMFRLVSAILSSKFILPHIPKIRKLAQKIEIFITKPFDRNYEEIFKKYKPDAVFSYSTYDWDAVPILRTAIRHKIKTIGAELSWDNITSKGEQMIRYDKLLVWNEMLKKDAIYYLDYHSEDIDITGAIPFNNFIRLKNKILSKKVFFEKIHANADKKLITYTTCSPLVCPYNDEIVEIIHNGIKNGAIKKPAQLLVRVYSRDDPTKYQRFKGLDGIIIDDSIHSTKIFPDGYEGENDIIWLASTMDSSDLVINVCSSTTIDASVFDKPVINIAFDGNKQLPYYESCRRWYDYTHYKRITATDGVKVAMNKDELYKYINEYLDNPSLDMQGRKRIVNEQCQFLDGKALDRMFDYLMKFLET